MLLPQLSFDKAIIKDITKCCDENKVTAQSLFLQFFLQLWPKLQEFSTHFTLALIYSKQVYHGHLEICDFSFIILIYMTVIMTIMMFGKNTSSPVTCLDLLCCAKPVGPFQKKSHLEHAGSSTLLSYLLHPGCVGARAQRCGHL